MKCLIVWDKNIIDGERRLLPNRDTLYTQIYSPYGEKSWSIVFKFSVPPIHQGYRTIADDVFFLSADAPKGILKPGFKFDFFDGPKKIGECEIFEENAINLRDILDRLETIEQEKHGFKNFITSIKDSTFEYTDEDLIKIIKYCNDYPFLFSLILRINKETALDYLNKHYFASPVDSLASYHTNLPLFLHCIKKELGEQLLNNILEGLPLDIKNHFYVKSAIDGIL